MNNYQQAKAKLEELKCKQCDGGGILFAAAETARAHATKCDSCNGTGLTNPVGKKRRVRKPGYSLR